MFKENGLNKSIKVQKHCFKHITRNGFWKINFCLYKSNISDKSVLIVLLINCIVNCIVNLMLIIMLIISHHEKLPLN